MAMAELFIVDDPSYNRLGALPQCPVKNVYSQAKPKRNLYTFLVEHSLCGPSTVQLPCIVFVHYNNVENEHSRDPFVPNEFQARATDWAEGVPLLAYAVRKVCSAGGRVVVFSGGGAVPWDDRTMAAVKRELELADLQVGLHCVSLSLGDIPVVHRVYEQPLVPVDWRVDSLVVLPPRNLVALSVLCQGFLIVEADVGRGFPVIDKSDQYYKSVADAMMRLFPPTGRSTFHITADTSQRETCISDIHCLKWWRDVFSDTTDLQTTLMQEWGGKKEGWQEVKVLADWIGPTASPAETGQSSATTGSESGLSLGIVAAAYCAIAERLETR